MPNGDFLAVDRDEAFSVHLGGAAPINDDLDVDRAALRFRGRVQLAEADERPATMRDVDTIPFELEASRELVARHHERVTLVLRLPTRPQDSHAATLPA